MNTFPREGTPRGVIRGVGMLMCAFAMSFGDATLSMAGTGGDAPSHPGRTAGVTGGPTINVWYGSPQRFGQEGVPQRRINILGNVSTANPPLSAFTYTLNGNDDVPLSVGPDLRRLSKSGDFNVDIPVEDLSPGNNTLAIHATDNMGSTTTATMTISWTPGKVWPGMYSVNWSNATTLSDSVQVVDGLWAIDGGWVRTTQPGYDRLIAIGDSSWTDYEVQTQVYVSSVDASDTAYDETNAGPAVGFLLRWNGHTDQPAFVPPITQPLTGYLPYGAIGWYHFRNHKGNGLTDRWELMGNNLNIFATDESTPLPVASIFNLKMRVKTSGGQGTYSLKAWENGTNEPSSWMLTGQGALTDPAHGSLLLLAHHIDVSFGAVRVSPLGALTAPSLVSPSNGSNGVFGGSKLIWNKVVNAGSYDVQVSTSSSFSSGMLVDVSGIRDTGYVLPSMPSSTTYYWHVRAENPDGAGSYSSTWSFTTTLQPPSIVSPAVNALNVAVPPTLLWTKINGSTYGLQVATDSTFGSGLVINTSGLTDTTSAPAGLQYNTRYFWRVNATFGGSTSAYSSVGSFRTTLASPVLFAPADASVNQSLPVTCSWHAVSGATVYRIQVSTDQTFATGMLLDDAGVSDTSRAVIGAQTATQYYWRVSAGNANGFGSFSGTRSFTTTLPAAVLISPANGSGGFQGSANLVWANIASAQTYHLQVSLDPAFASLMIFNDSTLVDTTHLMTTLENNTTFYWRVRGRNANGSGPFSAAWTFGTMLPAPVLLLPANGSTGQPLSETFRWSKVTNAVTYQLMLATDSTFGSGIVKNDTTLTDTTRVVNGLQNGVYYYWRLRAKNAMGAGSYSPTFSFRTIGIYPTQVVLVAPVSDVATPFDSTRFVWQRSAPSVTRYWMELAVDSAFSLRTVDSTITDTSKVIHGLVNGNNYWWKVRASNSEGWGQFSGVQQFKFIITGIENRPPVVQGYGLDQNYPNPFNPTTVISAQWSVASDVHLVVYDMLGREVAVLANSRFSAGKYSFAFNAANLASGVYFYRLTAGEFTAVKAMVLAR